MRSPQISRVHLNFILCGWTGVLTSRLWEMKLLLLYTSLTLIQEPHHSYCLTFDSETVGGKCVFGECFEGQWLSVKPCGQVAAESEPVQIGDHICNQSGLRAGQAMEDQLPLPLGATEWCVALQLLLILVLWWRILASGAIDPSTCMNTKSVFATKALTWEDGDLARPSWGAPAVPSLLATW